MAKVAELYRRGTEWFRAEDLRAKGDQSGCTGCFFYAERLSYKKGVGDCETRPCISSQRTDKREVIFRLIPEATSRRFKTFKSRPGFLWLRHPLQRQCIKALPNVRIVDIK